MINKILLSCALVAFSATSVIASDTLTVTGCGISKKAYMKKALDAYTKKEGLTPRLSGGGATKGIRLAAKGAVDMGATCRQRLSDVGGNIFEEEKDVDLIHVGWDAIVVIGNKNMPVDNISKENLASVLNGEITNWQSLGGTDMKIDLLTRKGKNSGVGYMARMLIFNDPSYEYKAKSKQYKSTGPIEKAVVALPGAIALDGISSARKTDASLIGIDGYKPTKENIASGKYPFFRPLYVAVNKTNKDPKVLGFVKFLLGPEGQKIISDADTVNIEEGSALMAMWDKRATDMGGRWQEDLNKSAELAKN